MKIQTDTYQSLAYKKVRCGNIAVRTSVRDYVACPPNHSETVATWRKHSAFFLLATPTQIEMEIHCILLYSIDINI